MACLTSPTSQPTWTFIPFGSQSLAMRLLIHREDRCENFHECPLGY